MNLENLTIEINKLNNEIHRDEGKLEALKDDLSSCESKLNIISEEIDTLDKVQTVLRSAAEFAREQAKNNIEKLVGSFLQFIFETDMDFVIEMSTLRNVPNADFYVVSNFDGYTVKTNPETSRGGGVVDIVSLALRLAFLQLRDPELDGPLILDEPGKHVSEDYIFNFGEFIKINADHYKRQIIMVTHNRHLSEFADSAVRVTIQNGVSQVETIEK